MKDHKVFIGASDSCDFESNTWTFAMNGDFRVGSGEYAIMRLADYRELLERVGANAMSEQEIKPSAPKPTICHKHG